MSNDEAAIEEEEEGLEQEDSKIPRKRWAGCKMFPGCKGKEKSVRGERWRLIRSDREPGYIRITKSIDGLPKPCKFRFDWRTFDVEHVAKRWGDGEYIAELVSDSATGNKRIFQRTLTIEEGIAPKEFPGTDWSSDEVMRAEAEAQAQAQARARAAARRPPAVADAAENEEEEEQEEEGGEEGGEEAEEGGEEAEEGEGVTRAARPDPRRDDRAPRTGRDRDESPRADDRYRDRPRADDRDRDRPRADDRDHERPRADDRDRDRDRDRYREPPRADDSDRDRDRHREPPRADDRDRDRYREPPRADDRFIDRYGYGDRYPDRPRRRDPDEAPPEKKSDGAAVATIIVGALTTTLSALAPLFINNAQASREAREREAREREARERADREAKETRDREERTRAEERRRDDEKREERRETERARLDQERRAEERRIEELRAQARREEQMQFSNQLMQLNAKGEANAKNVVAAAAELINKNGGTDPAVVAKLDALTNELVRARASGKDVTPGGNIFDNFLQQAEGIERVSEFFGGRRRGEIEQVPPKPAIDWTPVLQKLVETAGPTAVMGLLTTLQKFAARFGADPDGDGGDEGADGGDGGDGGDAEPG